MTPSPPLSVEAQLIEAQWAQLRHSHPDLGHVIDELWTALDLSQTTVKDQLQLKGLVGTVGRRLKTLSPERVQGFRNWLERFVQEGSLGSDEAAALIARVESLAHA
jgi:hypothetical protein